MIIIINRRRCAGRNQNAVMLQSFIGLEIFYFFLEVFPARGRLHVRAARASGSGRAGAGATWPGPSAYMYTEARAWPILEMKSWRWTRSSGP